jgi:hypothetical protein
VPLLAIAEAGGGDWKKAGWQAALAIEAVAATFDPSVGVQLLWAMRSAFKRRADAPQNKDRITSADLITDLVADATAPWATYNKGKPNSQRQVASLFKDYGIKPKTIKLADGSPEGKTAKGYLLEWFADVFERFCTSSSAPPPDLSVTSVTDLFSKDFSRFSSVTSPTEVTDKKDGESFDNNDVAAVTDKNRGEARKEDIEP